MNCNYLILGFKNSLQLNTITGIEHFVSCKRGCLNDVITMDVYPFLFIWYRIYCALASVSIFLLSTTLGTNNEYNGLLENLKVLVKATLLLQNITSLLNFFDRSQTQLNFTSFWSGGRVFKFIVLCIQYSNCFIISAVQSYIKTRATILTNQYTDIK